MIGSQRCKDETNSSIDEIRPKHVNLTVNGETLYLYITQKMICTVGIENFSIPTVIFKRF